MSRSDVDYIAYFNGEWMPLREVRIDPLDSGFTVGDVVFDLARTFNGKSFRTKEHVDQTVALAEIRSHRPGHVSR